LQYNLKHRDRIEAPEAWMKKSEMLFAANYRYNIDRDLYVNPRTKKAFSIEYVDDHSIDEIRQSIEEATDHSAWRFYFNQSPSEKVRSLLEEDLEAA
jgi:hypothetical protein